MQLSFNEITGWSQFEELCAAYFRSLQSQEQLFETIDVQLTGTGTDGGKDIILDIKMSDYLSRFSRKWLIQCKFHDNDISPRDLNDINIPTLIHSYNADGYLLICKKRVTSKLETMFMNLSSNCSLNYSYSFWTGDQFLSNLLGHPKVLQQYFPLYYGFIDSKRDIAL